MTVASVPRVVVECPPDDVLRELARNTGVAADLSRHLESCDDCVARIAGLVHPPLPEPASRLLPGARLGRYRIVELLGSGGMAEVYEAVDTELERGVALKVVRSDLTRDVLERRLRRESKLIARTRHPSVITVYDVGRAGGEVYLAMELIRGGTARDWLEQGPRSLPEILAIYRRAGAGLAAAHRAGLVHRDFKPDNVLVEMLGGRVERVLVTDFGVARAMYGAQEPGVRGGPATVEATVAGALIGTPAYMAPEQLDGSTVDTRADVFAFAASIWEAVYGTRPFPGLTVPEIVVAMHRGPVIDPAHAMTNDPVPPQIERTLRAALALAAADRTQTVGEVIAGLALPGPRRRRVGRFLAAAGITAALAAAGVIVRVTSDPCAVPHGSGELAAAVARATWARELEGWSGVASYPDGWSKLRTGACTTGGDALPARLACLDAERRWTIAQLDGLSAASAEDRRDVLAEMLPPAPPAQCMTPAAPALADLHPTAAETANAGAILVGLAKVRASITAGVIEEVSAGTATEALDHARAQLAELAPAIAAARIPALAARRDVLAALLEDARASSDGQLPRVALRLRASGEFRAATLAWVEHLQYLFWRHQDQRVLDALPAAEQTLHLAGDPPQLVAMLSTLRAIGRAYEQDFVAAREALAEGDRARAASGPTDLDDAAVRCFAVGVAAPIDDAVACTRDALHTAIALSGESSLRATLLALHHANALSMAAYPDDAVAVLNRLIDNRRGRSTMLDAHLISELIRTQAVSERPVEAIAAYESHRELLETFGEIDGLVAAADAYATLGRIDDAYATARIAYDVDVKRPVASQFIRMRYMELALEAGHAVEAETVGRPVIVAVDDGAGVNDLPPEMGTVVVHAIWGRVLAALGASRRAEAIAELEHVVAPRSGESMDITESLEHTRGRAALALAQLLPADERERARELVQGAIVAFRAHPAHTRRNLAEAEAWIAAHP